MTNVGIHGLTCMDGNDYGAVALSMQANARAIDATLDAIRDDFVAYGNRYTARFTGGSATVSANSGQGLPDGTAAGSIISRGLGTLPRGWYEANTSMTFQESGAVTAGSYRRAVILINAIETKIPPTFYQVITVATGTGTPESLTVNAWFYSNGVTSTNVNTFFGHGNTGSTINVATGSVLTVRYLASGVVV